MSNRQARNARKAAARNGEAPAYVKPEKTPTKTYESKEDRQIRIARANASIRRREAAVEKMLAPIFRAMERGQGHG